MTISGPPAFAADAASARKSTAAWRSVAATDGAAAHARISPPKSPAHCLIMSRPSKIVIASRESRLAMWQAVHVRERLSSLNPGSEVVILGMTTKGDQILDRPLAEIGGKGLFIREL